MSKFWINWNGVGERVLWSDRAYLSSSGWNREAPIVNLSAVPREVEDQVIALVTGGAEVEDRIGAVQ